MGKYPDFPQTAHRTHWRDQLPKELDHVVNTHGTTLAILAWAEVTVTVVAASSHVVDIQA